MVTISEIIENVVDSLPQVTIGTNNYTIRFFEGILDDVKEQINTYKKINEMPYPCVWLIHDFQYLEELNRYSFTNLTLYFLIDTEGSFQAPERLETRINPYLIPIKDQLIRGLKLSGVFVSNVRPKKLTFLGNPNAGVSTNNSKTNSRIFADYLDGLQLIIDISYEFNLKLTCYEFR